MVFFLPVGQDSCRGFSIWDEHAPVIVVNTWWKSEARIFTMLHELGHLVTRSNSACLEQAGDGRREPRDPVERWCEGFAARVLIPEQELRDFLIAKYRWKDPSLLMSLDVARSAARRFQVSTTAAVLRMISIGAASWDLYRMIPRAFDQALQADVFGRDDVLGYLRVGDDELDEMVA